MEADKIMTGITVKDDTGTYSKVVAMLREKTKDVNKVIDVTVSIHSPGVYSLPMPCQRQQDGY